MAGVMQWQKDQAKVHADEELDFNLSKEEFDRELAAAKKSKVPTDQMKALHKRAPIKPRHRYNTPSKVTTNAIFKELEVGWPTFGLFSDEAGSLLHAHSLKEQNGPVEFASALTMLWDRGAADRATGEITVRLRGKRLSGLLMAQPEVAREFLQNRQLKAHGIHARIGIVQAPPWNPIVVDFCDPAEEARRAKLLSRVHAFSARIYDLLATPLAYEDGSVSDLDPTPIRWEMSAKKLAVDICRQCIEMRSEEDETYWKRLFEHVCRTAGVLAAFEGLDRITPSILEAAWALVQFYADQWKHLDVGVASARDTTKADFIDRVLKALRKNNAPMTAREIERTALQRVDRDVRCKVLADMVADEFIEANEETRGTRKVVTYSLPAGGSR